MKKINNQKIEKESIEVEFSYQMCYTVKRGARPDETNVPLRQGGSWNETIK